MESKLFQISLGTQLLMRDNNYLATLSNGQHLNLTEPLYHLLDALKHPHSVRDLLDKLKQVVEMDATEEELDELLTQFLQPQGLIVEVGEQNNFKPLSSTPNLSEPSSIVDLHLYRSLIPERWLLPITNRLKILYAPLLAIFLVVAIVLTQVLTLTQIEHLADFYIRPQILPLLIVFLLVSTIFHELGHMAACRSQNAQHGDLGVGLYFFMPVFYAEVDDAWRLSKWQRVTVNLGGMYFQLLLTIILLALFGLSRDNLYLWFIVMTNLTVIFNLNPVLKLDGYWVVTDAFMISNLHKRSKDLVDYLLGTLAHVVRLKPSPPTMSPFLESLSRFQRVVIGVYLIFSAVIIVLMASVSIPFILSQFSLVPLIVSAFIQRFSMLTPQMIFEGGVYLIVPILVIINLMVIARRLLRTVARANLPKGIS